jgi:hypothetical protein
MTKDSINLSRTQFEQLLNTVRSFENEPDELYTTKESCKYLKCSSVTFWKIRREENIHPVYIRRKMFFRKSVLDAYLTRSKEGCK